MKNKTFKPFNIGAVEPFPNMTREELKIRLFELLPKVLLASIPDNISDNDPELIEKIRDVYNKWIDEYKTQFPGTDISCLEVEAIRELKHKLTEFEPTLHSRADRIKVKRFIKFLNEQEKRITSRKKSDPSFDDLFFDKRDMAVKVDKILEDNEYTKDGNWIDPGNLKKIATAFYVLKDQYPEINVIRVGPLATQLRVWCKHYGVIVKEKGGDVTIENLKKRPQRNLTEKPDYIEFMELFAPLKK